MALLAVVLDTSPAGLVTQKPGKSAEADACRTWMENLLAAGVDVYLPEIADYEVRRELIRSGQTRSIARLDALQTVLRYLPITTQDMLEAARLWAMVRNAGLTTADVHALNGDVILAAQALSLGLPATDFIVATSNVRHISRVAPADLWSRSSFEPSASSRYGLGVKRLRASHSDTLSLPHARARLTHAPPSC